MQREKIMSDIAIRLDVQSVYAIKVQYKTLMEKLIETDKEIGQLLEPIHAYAPYRLDFRYDDCHERRIDRNIDRSCWNYLIRLYDLEKWMLCTEYKKLQKDIETYSTPEFTIANAEGWVLGLKALIHDNVRVLIKQVYESITQETYLTGGNYHTGTMKKRNNNGIDKSFIITTRDYQRIFNSWSTTPTITDDLEKACYILDGKCLPDVTLMNQARSDRSSEVENAYFSVRFCQNGNTHYVINDEIREKLNRWGPTGNIIGENIKIKIFEK
jgi:hypothetical protein